VVTLLYTGETLPDVDSEASLRVAVPTPPATTWVSSGVLLNLELDLPRTVS
jgi:hypothetical protein